MFGNALYLLSYWKTPFLLKFSIISPGPVIVHYKQVMCQSHEAPIYKILKYISKIINNCLTILVHFNPISTCVYSCSNANQQSEMFGYFSPNKNHSNLIQEFPDPGNPTKALLGAFKAELLSRMFEQFKCNPCGKLGCMLYS